MPVRITCPSCSATLSVKDEYAGRAVKCPKCGGVIPASQPPASPPAAPPPAMPAPQPERGPFEALDEPVPATPGNKPARPMADDDEDNRPAKRGSTDTGDEDAPRRKKGARAADEDRDDRPAKRKRRDDDDDERPARGKKVEGGSNVAIILGVVGLLLLTCCGGVGFGVYYFMQKAGEVVKQGAEDLQRAFSPVTLANYNQLKVGASTRTEMELSLGNGKIATTDDLKTAFVTDQKRIDAWTPKVAEGRAVVWRNGDDFLLAAFHPNAEAAGRLQMKEWRPKNGATAQDGEPDDAKFVAAYPPGKGGSSPKLTGSEIEITAEELARAFDEDERGARLKYHGKMLVVSGPLAERAWWVPNLRFVLLSPKRVRCVIKPGSEGGLGEALRGQKVRLRGRCQGDAGDPEMESCEVLSVEPVEFVTVTADRLLTDFETAPKDALLKYANPKKENYLHVTSAEVAAISPTPVGVEVILKGIEVKDTKLDIAVRSNFGEGDRISKLKVGDRIAVKGVAYVNGGYLRIDWATIAP